MIYEKTIGAKVTVETYQQVQLLAGKRECNPSDVVRDAVCYYMKQHSSHISSESSSISLRNQYQNKWTHSSTESTTEETRKSHPTSSIKESIKAKNIQIMKNGKSAGELVGGLIVALIMLSK